MSDDNIKFEFPVLENGLSFETMLREFSLIKSFCSRSSEELNKLRKRVSDLEKLTKKKRRYEYIKTISLQICVEQFLLDKLEAINNVDDIEGVSFYGNKLYGNEFILLDEWEDPNDSNEYDLYLRCG